MLILDRNNEPTSTVYYLAASIYGYLKTYNGIDASSLYQKILLMALDFLYLMDCVTVDKKGDLHVH